MSSKAGGDAPEEERRKALSGLEPEEEELEVLEEGRLRWAVEKAFIPPPWLPRRGEGAENQEIVERKKASERESKVKVSAHPSTLPSLTPLAFKLAARGYLARLRVVRVRDLGPAKLLPPILLKPLGGRAVRLELEVLKPDPV